MISSWHRARAALVLIAFTVCQCGGGGGGSSGNSNSCPLVSSGRTIVDGGGLGLNLGNDNADNPHVVEMNGKIYAAWSEYVVADSADEIQVSVYNGNDSAPSWTRVVAGNGLNYSSSATALSPRLISFNGKLYATWIEDAAGPSVQLRAAVYNGDDSSPSWSFVDGNAATGLNKSTSQFATLPQLISFDSSLYLVWVETNAGMVTQIRVAKYNGDDSSPSWSFVDGNGANGLNRSTAQDADYPSAVVYNSKLYLSWSESNGTNDQVRVAVYGGGSTWTFVDGNLSSGLNYSSSADASRVMAVAGVRDLVVFWLESGTMRVKVYGGVDTNPTWTFLDGGGASGVRVSGSPENERPAPFILGYNIMAGWMEQVSGSVPGLRLGYNNGSPWQILAGSGSTALNFDPSLDAYKPVAVVTSSCKVYMVWTEADNGLGTNRVRAAVLY